MMGVAALFTSCMSEDQDFTVVEKGQKANLVLDLKADASFGEKTRALTEADYLVTDNYTVEIYNVDKQKSEWTGLAKDFSSKLLETQVNYKLVASYGAEHAYSRDQFLMYGETSFSFTTDGEEKNVSVECTPTCGKLVVAFDESMATYYDNYSVTYSGTSAMGNNTITWAKADTEPWYVALESAGESISYTINLTAKDAYAHVNTDGTKTTTAVVTGTIAKLERNKAHKLSIKPNYTTATDGTLTLSIVIDETTNDKNVDIEVPVSWI